MDFFFGYAKQIVETSFDVSNSEDEAANKILDVIDFTE